MIKKVRITQLPDDIRKYVTSLRNPEMIDVYECDNIDDMEKIWFEIPITLDYALKFDSNKINVERIFLVGLILAQDDMPGMKSPFKRIQFYYTELTSKIDIEKSKELLARERRKKTSPIWTPNN